MAEIEQPNTGQQGSNEFAPMTSEEQIKLQKNRKRELIAGAIGEGLTSLSNLFFATKGAPTTSSNLKRGNRYPTLLERIYGRHKEEDAAYEKQKSVWEKEHEKKRKEAEMHAKKNEIIEDIHPDFQPKLTTWEQKTYIDTLYEQLRAEIIKNAESINTKKGIGTRKIDIHGETFTPSRESSVIKYMDGYNTKGDVGRHMKAELIREILSGDYKDEELSDEFLDRFRKDAQDDHDNWIKYK